MHVGGGGIHDPIALTNTVWVITPKIPLWWVVTYACWSWWNPWPIALTNTVWVTTLRILVLMDRYLCMLEVVESMTHCSDKHCGGNYSLGSLRHTSRKLHFLGYAGHFHLCPNQTHYHQSRALRNFLYGKYVHHFSEFNVMFK